VTRADRRGGARPGAGRKKADPALVAARNLRAGRRAQRENREPETEAEIDAWIKRLLLARLADAGLPPDATEYEWRWYRTHRRERLAAGWQEHGPEILARWMEQHPGTRPTCWWDFEAPRGAWPGLYYDGEFAEPRRRVGGRGTPDYEVLNYAPHYERGVPTGWVSDWQIAYYTGKKRDVHGNPIGTEYIGKDFPAERFDRADPPRFESQAAYLERLSLLAPGEARRLGARDFQPEPLPARHWPDQEESK
jgi:hypothetical protein